MIRHGKAENPSAGQRDYDRALNPRGERDGARMQDWLAQHAHPAQWVWCSSAKRAQHTATFVAKAFAAELIEQDELYLADPSALLHCLQTTPESAAGVAIVAHNPGLTYLINALAGTQVAENLVTWGCVRFSWQGEWCDLKPGQLTFEEMVGPKQLSGA